MKCHYCQTFATTPKSLRKLVGEPGRPRKSIRYCRKIHKDVGTESEMCTDLTPHPYFWCEEWGGWVHVIACLVRRKRKIYPCVSCHQYEEVEYVCVGRDMFEMFDVRRREFNPVKQPKPTGKPVLKRRKVNTNGN